ncbi:alanine racemase [Klebsiella pneumoniae]|uniref:Alanine racemase n=1 Tax=Klebsiella pneumoniae TaxID=573 RepID=A0A378FRN3_KLEPN|nr:alanine racemase [Klebsiella pneumoniae]
MKTTSRRAWRRLTISSRLASAGCSGTLLPPAVQQKPVGAEHFDWCHTVDRLKIATRLNEQRPAHLPPLKVLIQINISDEQSKSGIPLEALDGLAAEIAELPHLELRGLMAIPAPESEYVRQFAVARQMAVAFARLKTRYPTVDTLSLGMSDDMEAAIAAGSTMVRIGTAIFGARDYSK